MGLTLELRIRVFMLNKKTPLKGVYESHTLCNNAIIIRLFKLSHLMFEFAELYRALTICFSGIKMLIVDSKQLIEIVNSEWLCCTKIS